MAGISSSMIEGAGLPFKEALEFFDDKVNIPTREWGDVWNAAHAHAFTVAGAASEGLLNDFREAIRKALSDGTTLTDFRKSFDEIVAKHGWEYHGTAGWRSRLIYETNLNMAYAAGRYKQMTDPDVAAVFPYWTYRHSGNPHPRLQHKAWDGLTLPIEDGFWSTNYPPNGFNCGCWVEPQMMSDLKRMGKKGPDASPDLQKVDVVNKRTGEVRQTTKGVDAGFNYNVGEAWLKGKDKALAKDLSPRFKATPVAPPAPTLPQKTFRDVIVADQQIRADFADWRKTVTKDEETDTAYYRSELGPDLNAKMRQGGTVEPWLSRIIQSVSGMIARVKTKRDLVVWRGLKDHSFLRAMKPGDIYVDDGFVSTSLRLKTAKHFASKGGIVEIELPQGTEAAYIADIPDEGQKQYELLIQAGSHFEVISHDPQRIRLRLIPTRRHTSGTAGVD